MTARPPACRSRPTATGSSTTTAVRTSTWSTGRLRLPEAGANQHADLPDQPPQRGHRAGQQGRRRLLRQRRVVVPRRQRQRALRRLHVEGHQRRGPGRQRAPAGHLPEGHADRGHDHRRRDHRAAARHPVARAAGPTSATTATARLQLGRDEPRPRRRQRPGRLLRHPAGQPERRAPGQPQQRRPAAQRLQLPLPAHRQRLGHGLRLLRHQRHRRQRARPAASASTSATSAPTRPRW